jgi:hypothetical protein
LSGSAFASAQPYYQRHGVLAQRYRQQIGVGQPVVIENRPGAAGNIATEAVVRATPDGYTLLLPNGANAVSATLYEKLSFDFMRDIAPMRARLVGLGLQPMSLTSVGFGKFIADQINKWAKVIKAANIKPDDPADIRSRSGYRDVTRGHLFVGRCGCGVTPCSLKYPRAFAHKWPPVRCGQ